VFVPSGRYFLISLYFHSEFKPENAVKNKKAPLLATHSVLAVTAFLGSVSNEANIR
jgi:hypothetical protein